MAFEKGVHRRMQKLELVFDGWRQEAIVVLM
jgi:hypothetical protein